MCLKNKIKPIIFIIYLVAFNLEASSWQNFRFNRTRRGSKQELLIPPGSPQGWSFEIQGEILGSCVVKDDIVFFAARDLSVWALDAKTGEVLWQYSTSGRIDCTPTVWKDYVYVLSYDGKLYCFRKFYSYDEDCVPLWSYDTQSRSASSLVIIEDEEITAEDAWLGFVSGPKLNGTPEGYIYILRAKDGSLVKRIPLNSFSYSSLSYADGKLYFASNKGTIYCYDLKQDRFLWQKNLSSCFYFSSVVVEDNIYIYAGDIERKIYILDKNTSDVIWESPQLSNIATDNNSICLYRNKLIVNIYPTSLWKESSHIYRSSQTILCISTTTKQIIWRKDFLVETLPNESYNFTSAASVVGEVVFVGTNSGKLYAFDVNSGEILSQYDFTSPIVGSVAAANGWIYFAETKGKVHGIKSEKFLSIKHPDEEDLVINFTTISVLSEKYQGRSFTLECIDYKNGYSETIVSSTLTDDNINITWSTKHLLDGKYTLRLKISPTEYSENEIYIDNSPLPPMNVSASIYQKTKIQLTWTKSPDDQSGNNDVRYYNIYYSTDSINYTLLDYVLSGTTSYIHTPTIFSTTYYYKLTAKDKHSHSEFTSVKFVYMPSLEKPKPPLNLKIANYKAFISSGVLTLSWEKPTEDHNTVKYNLYRKIDSSEFVLYDTISFTNTSFYHYIDTLNVGSTYYYLVKSVNFYDIESDSSNIVSFYSFGITKPSAPREFTVFDTPNDSGGTLTLRWLYSFDEYSSISKVVSYNIFKSSDSTNYYLYDTIYDLGKTTYNYIDINCPTGVTFYYYITATNQHGLESEPSEVNFAYSLNNIIEISSTPPKPPSFITALDYPNDDGSKLLLLWSLSEDDIYHDNIIKYNIYRSSDKSMLASLFYQVPAKTSWYVDTDVILGTTYYYYLTALDKFFNESERTPIVFAYSLADGIPSAVENLKVTQLTLENIAPVVLVSWDKSKDDGSGFDDVERYKVFKSTDSLIYNLLVQLPKGATFFIDSQLEPQKLYYYYVVVVDRDGYESKKSEVVSIYTYFEVLVKPDNTYTLEYKKDKIRIEVFIDDRSLSQETKIKINHLDITPEFPEFIKNTHLIFEFLPKDLKLKKPIKVRFYYTNEDIKNLIEEQLRIFWYDELSSEWKVVDASKVNIQENYVEVEFYSFGVYALAEYSSKHAEAVRDEYVYTFPSPAKSDELYFKFLLYQPAKIKIYVYDISGDIVWQSPLYIYTQQDIGKTHLIKWNIKNLATGTYLFRLEAKTERSTKNVIKKFAVIH